MKTPEDYLIKAINTAKTILKFDSAIFIFAAVMAIEWMLFATLSELKGFANVLRTLIIAASLVWFVPLAVIINWFISYGGAISDEAEFLKVKKDLIMSFALWFAANALNFLLLNFKGWFDFR